MLMALKGTNGRNIRASWLSGNADTKTHNTAMRAPLAPCSQNKIGTERAMLDLINHLLRLRKRCGGVD
jgi:hypothetical protein